MAEDQNPTAGASTGGRRSQAASSTSQSSAADTTSQATTAGSTEQADSSASTSWQSQDTSASSGQRATGESSQSSQAEGTVVDQLMDRGKKWIEDSNLGQRVNDLPNTLRDFGQQAVSRVGSLSTTQKIVGGAILAAGLGWLATRGRSARGQSDTESYGAASGSRPGSRYSSNSYGSRGSASYASGDASRSKESGSDASASNYGSGRSASYQRGSHFRTGDADGFSNASDE